MLLSNPSFALYPTLFLRRNVSIDCPRVLLENDTAILVVSIVLELVELRDVVQGWSPKIDVNDHVKWVGEMRNFRLKDSKALIDERVSV